MTRTILTRGIFLKEWDFPENDAWHVCEVGSTGGTVAFLTLVIFVLCFVPFAIRVN